MSAQKADIIAQLRKDILSLEGFKPVCGEGTGRVRLGPVDQAFPNKIFPTGAIHEFQCPAMEDAAATSGFIAGILSTLMHKGGATLWISQHNTIFPPALRLFGIEPDKVIFVRLQKEKDILWAMEEALKCDGLAAVVGELQDISFTASRRLQLAVEQSRVTGFVIRRSQKDQHTTACVARWKITSIPSATTGGMPGVGFARWNVSILKVRNGSPGTWQLEWTAGRFRHIPKLTAIPLQQKRKTG